jgi:hypothetical protein
MVFMAKMKLLVQNDLVSMGYNYIVQDIDTVWRSDPRIWLLKNRQRGFRYDIEISYDGRKDEMGPGNSG